MTPTVENNDSRDRPLGRVLSPVQFWAIMERWGLTDPTALELLGHPVRIGASGKRPRLRFSAHESRITSYLPELAAALAAAGQDPGWLQQKNRASPFNGRAPVEVMLRSGTHGIAAVLRFLNRAAFRAAIAG